MSDQNTRPTAEKVPDLCGELVQKIRKLEGRVKTLKKDMHRRQVHYTNHELRDQALLEKKEADRRHLESAYKQLVLEYKEKCQEIEGMKAEHPALHFYLKKVQKTFAEASTQTEERKEEDIGEFKSSGDDEESKGESDGDDEVDSDVDNTEDEFILFKGRSVQQASDIIVFKGRRNEEDTEDILLFRGRRSLV